MGVSYKTVLWNKHKKKYDRWIFIGALLYLLTFAGVTFATNSETSIETLIIRAFGTLALVMLHLILAIGPLARLYPGFLPILYNRRHLGVSMFLAALVHGGFSIFQFHALGDVNPIYSIFTSNLEYNSLGNFPFQTLGFFALLVLFLMAATSHDFWLKNLSPKTWKRLHMMVYLAYALLLLHVFLGAFQQQPAVGSIIMMSLGFVLIASLHLVTAIKERKLDRRTEKSDTEGWQYVCELQDIPEDRAKIFTLHKERIAVFKYDGKLSAIYNVCKHQGGPLGEGKVVDGCVTCPWHGYQYVPGNGQSPPPFTEMVATYRLKKLGNAIYVHEDGLPEGTAVEPVAF